MAKTAVSYYIYEMIIMTSTEARTKFGDFLEKGSREPVIIKRQQREIGAFIPIEEYRRLRKLSIRELNEAAHQISDQASARGLTEEKLNEILAEINPS
jgi:PHD/YefM family antitoxin component YafN of YafNO toxin-antitoxin module